MRQDETYQRAIGELRDVLRRSRSDEPSFQEWMSAKDDVLAQYQPIFNLDYLPKLTKEEFHSFLLFKNNKHWTGLQRLSSKICSNITRLREALTSLLDESEPIEERLTAAVETVPGMGRAVATGVLLVAYPDRYGVWNNTSEGGLKAVELWPTFDRGETLGERYIKVNRVLTQLAEDLELDLWTLDILWYEILAEKSDSEGLPKEPQALAEMEPEAEEVQRFGMERHLHEFLRDNWSQTELGQAWDLYSEPGEPEAGFEYPCGVGRIDLLARSKSGTDWLVVELKRNQTSDTTVGQVLRYMGWVEKHLAVADERVRGLIIAHEADDTILYALMRIPDVNLKLYEVEFHLRDPLELLTE